VPGAVNAPCSDNLDAAGRFRSAAELEARYRALLGGVPPDAAVVMCGSGVTACHDILAMTLAGLAGARLYVGSWSAWSADAARPMAPGR
jgi:thiosulfate/3-mercaptopyruvate sulfurtransferase